MKLSEIKLLRLPGIESPFEIGDFSGGINVIVGPNASGKTSICRAVSAVLWPRELAPDYVEIDSLWCEALDAGTVVLRAELRRDSTRWQRDGEDVEAPQVPPAHLASCYTLGVRDLLGSANQADEELARDIRRQMSGGYDLEALAEDRFKTKTREEKSKVGNLTRARKRIAKAESEVRALAEEEDRLQDLRRQEREAREASSELARLQSAVDLAAERAQLDQVESALSEFSAAMADIRGDEGKTLDEIESDLAKAQEKASAARRRIDEAVARIEKAGFAESNADVSAPRSWDTPGPEQLTEADTRVSMLRDAERELGEADTRVAEARTSLEKARALLGEMGADPRLPDISAASLDRLEKLLNASVRIKAEGAARDARIAVLASEAGVAPTEEQTSPAAQTSTETGTGAASEAGVRAGSAVEVTAATVRADAERLGQAAERLRDWLSEPRIMPYRLPVWIPAVACTVAVAASGLYLAWDPQPYFLSLAAGGAGFGLAWLLVVMLKPRASSALEAHVRKFVETGFGAPRQWNFESVRELLRDIEGRRAAALARASKLTEYESRLAERAQFERELREWEASRTELQEQLGIDAGGELTLLELARRIRDLCVAEQELAAASAAREQAAARYSSLLETLNTLLSRFGYDENADYAEASAALLDLRSRADEHRLAVRDFDDAQRELSEAEKDCGRQLEKRRKQFLRCGLEDGDRRGLDELLASLDDYSALCDEKKELCASIEKVQRKLEGYPGLLELRVDELEERLRQAEQQAGGLEKILEEITTIKQRIRSAEEDSELEEAIAEEERVRHQLADCVEDSLTRAAARFLIDSVLAEHESEGRPPVLEKAAEYFAAFTRNRYELRVSGSGDARFYAKDTSTNKGLALSELSDGTRVQLLLAVRLAFALQAESGGVSIPIFLDEALSTADPERFRAVAQSLCMLAAEGRQVFYMTSNPADASHWESICSDKPKSRLKIVEDLASLRAGQTAVISPQRLAVLPRREVPTPAGKSAQEYAVALKVGPADPCAPPGTLHLFYLLADDLDALYELIKEFELSAVGQWESFSRGGRAGRFVDEELRKRLDFRCACVRRVYENRAIGRGRPVDAEAIDSSGAVSKTFRDRFVELAEQLGGDAEAFMAAIEEGGTPLTKGVHKTTKEELRAYLEAEGYIDRQAVLPPAEVASRTLDQVYADFDGDAAIPHEEALRFVREIIERLG